MFKRGGKYYAWNPLTGRRESTRCTDKEAARLVVAEWERRAADPTYHDAASKTLGHGAQLLTLALKREGKSEGTQRMYDQKIAQLGRVLGDLTPLQELMRSDVVDGYVSTREREGVTASTIHKELVALRQILRHAKRRKWVRGELDEVMPVGYSPRYTPRTTVIDQADWPRLLDEVAYVTPKQRPRDRNTPKPIAVPFPRHRAAQIAFALATGANANEVARARRRHIDLKAGFVFIDGTKRESRRRHVPVMATTKRLLERVLRDAPGKEPDDLLFSPWPNMRRDLHKRCVALKLPKVTSNDLRRSFGSMLARAGVPFEVIAKLMGHKSTKMVMEVYGQMRPEDLAAIVRKMVVAPGRRGWDKGGTAIRKRPAPSSKNGERKARKTR